MATSPLFASVFVIGQVRNLAVANTASDGSGTINIFQKNGNGGNYSAVAAGSRLDRINIINSQATAAASSAMVIRIFVSDAAGANWVLIREVALATATRSTTVIGATTQILFPSGLVLASGQQLGVVQSVYAGVQDTMSYIAEFAELT
ncbi:MAG: hypothetical protein WCJ33_01525 [Pseudomonadota bacterium]